MSDNEKTTFPEDVIKVYDAMNKHIESIESLLEQQKELEKVTKPLASWFESYKSSVFIKYLLLSYVCYVIFDCYFAFRYELDGSGKDILLTVLHYPLLQGLRSIIGSDILCLLKKDRAFIIDFINKMNCGTGNLYASFKNGFMGSYAVHSLTAE